MQKTPITNGKRSAPQPLRVKIQCVWKEKNTRYVTTKAYLGCIDFDLRSIREYFFDGIYFSKITSKGRSCMRIYVVNLENVKRASLVYLEIYQR